MVIVLHPSLQRALVAYGAGAILAGGHLRDEPRRRLVLAGERWRSLHRGRGAWAGATHLRDEGTERRRARVPPTRARHRSARRRARSRVVHVVNREVADRLGASDVPRNGRSCRRGESGSGVARSPSPRELPRAATQVRARRARRGRWARRRMRRTAQAPRARVTPSSAEASPAGVQARRRPPELLRASPTGAGAGRASTGSEGRKPGENDGRGLLAHPEGRDGPSSEDRGLDRRHVRDPVNWARCTRFLETTTACANSSSDEGPRTRGWATGGAWCSRSGTPPARNANGPRATASTSSSTAQDTLP